MRFRQETSDITYCENLKARSLDRRMHQSSWKISKSQWLEIFQTPGRVCVTPHQPSVMPFGQKACLTCKQHFQQQKSRIETRWWQHHCVGVCLFLFVKQDWGVEVCKGRLKFFAMQCPFIISATNHKWSEFQSCWCGVQVLLQLARAEAKLKQSISDKISN